MIAYLLAVYGLGGAWVWVLFFARGTVQVVAAVVVLMGTIGLAVVQRRRSRRLESPWEWIPSRAITHVGGGASRWNRDRRETPDDPDDFEAHVGGWS